MIGACQRREKKDLQKASQLLQNLTMLEHQLEYRKDESASILVSIKAIVKKSGNPVNGMKSISGNS